MQNIKRLVAAIKHPWVAGALALVLIISIWDFVSRVWVPLGHVSEEQLLAPQQLEINRPGEFHLPLALAEWLREEGARIAEAQRQVDEKNGAQGDGSEVPLPEDGEMPALTGARTFDDVRVRVRAIFRNIDNAIALIEQQSIANGHVQLRTVRLGSTVGERFQVSDIQVDRIILQAHGSDADIQNSPDLQRSDSCPVAELLVFDPALRGEVDNLEYIKKVAEQLGQSATRTISQQQEIQSVQREDSSIPQQSSSTGDPELDEELEEIKRLLEAKLQKEGNDNAN